MTLITLLLIAALPPAISTLDHRHAVPLQTGHAYKDGKTLRIPLNETGTEELLDKWMSQALSGFMAALASQRMEQLSTKDQEELHRCSKKAHSVPAHARCVVKVLDKTKHIKRPKVTKKKPSSSYKAATVKHKKSHHHTKHGNDERRADWIGSFRLARAKRSVEVMNRNSYVLPSSDEDTFVSKVIRQATKTVRRFKNKDGMESWRSAVQRVKHVGDEARALARRRKLLKKKLKQMIDNTPKEFLDPRKPLVMKQLELDDETLKKEKAKAKEKRDEIRIPLKVLRESMKIALQAAGKNVTDFDKKTLKLVSPRFMSLVPEQDGEELFNLLSPSLFSLHDGGDEFEKAMSLRNMLKQLPNKDQEAWLDFIVETAGVTDAVDKTEKVQKEQRERGLRGPDGTPLFLTKKNATEILGDTERRKIEVFEKLDKSYTESQKEDLDKQGYSFLNLKQLNTIYGPKSPYNKSDSLKLFKGLRKMRDDPHHLIEHDIRALAEAKKFSARRKQIVLSPFLLTWLTFQGAALSQAVVLSPLVLSPITLSPAVLGPIILSPWVFVPLVLSPRVLSPLIVNPLVFSPIVLSPLVLHPLILVPGVFNPFVLSPLVLSPFILSPQVFTPLILSPMVLNPLIVTPMAGSPLVLSPFVLSPIICSPQYLFALVLSPYALSPLVNSKLIASEVILSPSWLS